MRFSGVMLSVLFSVAACARVTAVRPPPSTSPPTSTAPAEITEAPGGPAPEEIGVQPGAAPTPFQADVVAGIERVYPDFQNCYEEPYRRGLSVLGRAVYGFRANGDGTVDVVVYQQHPREGASASVFRAVVHCIGRHLARVRVAPSISSDEAEFFYPFVFNE